MVSGVVILITFNPQRAVILYTLQSLFYSLYSAILGLFFIQTPPCASWDSVTTPGCAGAGAGVILPLSITTDTDMQTANLTTANCFDDAGFCDWWNRVEDLRFDKYNFLPIMDAEDFYLDCLIDAYNMGQDPEPTLESIADSWDPTEDTPYDFFH
jgi:hypothetical protein